MRNRRIASFWTLIGGLSVGAASFSTATIVAGFRPCSQLSCNSAIASPSSSVHHAGKGAGAMRAGQALRSSSEFHAWGDSNLYL